MIVGPVEQLEARLYARLPEHLHYTGDPTEWVRVTRPGQRLHSFLEGPCFDAEGRLWLTDVPYGRIFSIDAGGDFVLRHVYDGEPHGLAWTADGLLLVADYQKGLLQLDPTTGVHAVVCAGINTEPFRGLGDVAIAPNNDIWLTDPGRSSLSDPTGRIFRIKSGSTRPQLVLANLAYPNSVAFSPNGEQVYVSVTRANAVYRFLAEAPAPVWPMLGLYVQLSGGLGPDGMAVNSSGGLAVAQAQAGRAYIFSRTGDLRAIVSVPEGQWTTAVVFGPDERNLFIVEAQTGSIYRADLHGIDLT